MKVLVTGGRHYRNEQLVFSTLHDINIHEGIDFIIQGGATGADQLARFWATANKIPCASFHAHFSTMGKPAGPARNLWMIIFGYPDLVVAFPGNDGTANMVKQARSHGIPVRLIE